MEAAVAAPFDRAVLEARIAKLEAERNDLIRTVTFYAARSNWEREMLGEFDESPDSSEIEHDRGKRARDLLKSLGLR